MEGAAEILDATGTPSRRLSVHSRTTSPSEPTTGRAFSANWFAVRDRIPLRPSLATLVILILAAPLLLPRLFAWTLGLQLTIRLSLTALVLAPLGLLMGVPFPAGIRLMKREQDQSPEQEASSSVPWVWAVNGAASVVASILSALLALTFGFDWVLRLGALCYAGAWITVWAWSALLRRRAR